MVVLEPVALLEREITWSLLLGAGLFTFTVPLEVLLVLTFTVLEELVGVTELLLVLVLLLLGAGLFTFTVPLELLLVLTFTVLEELVGVTELLLVLLLLGAGLFTFTVPLDVLLVLTSTVLVVEEGVALAFTVLFARPLAVFPEDPCENVVPLPTACS